jgi:hypothetical protein
MATGKTLKSLKLAGFSVSPNDQWTLPLMTLIKETERNLDGTLTRLKKPVASKASGPIRTPAKNVLEAILNTEGWELVATLYDGTTYTMTDCSVDNEAMLETDGGVTPLEISGDPQGAK